MTQVLVNNSCIWFYTTSYIYIYIHRYLVFILSPSFFDISSTYFQKQNPPVFSWSFSIQRCWLRRSKICWVRPSATRGSHGWKASNLVLTNALRWFEYVIVRRNLWLLPTKKSRTRWLAHVPSLLRSVEMLSAGISLVGLPLVITD